MEGYTLGKEGSTQLIGLAADSIEILFEHYESLKEMSVKLFGAPLAEASFVNNLKDSLMHYKKMYYHYDLIASSISDEGDKIVYGNNNIQLLIQFEFLSEHLTRGIVDVYISLLQYGSRYFETFYRTVLSNQKGDVSSSVKVFLHTLFKAIRFCKTQLNNLRTNKHALNRIINVDTMRLDDNFLKIFSDIIDTLDNINKEISPIPAPFNSLHTALLRASYYGYNIYKPSKDETVQNVACKFNMDYRLFCEINGINHWATEMPVEGFEWLIIPPPPEPSGV